MNTRKNTEEVIVLKHSVSFFPKTHTTPTNNLILTLDTDDLVEAGT